VDLPLSDQVMALIRTVISLFVAAATVAGYMHFGFALASAYFGVGLGAFTAMQITLGRAMRSRTATTTTEES
jgi:hypothetical protein